MNESKILNEWLEEIKNEMNQENAELTEMKHNQR